MSNLVMWTMIVGFAMPPIIAFFQQPSFSPPVRAIITAIFSITGGGVTAYLNDLFNPEDIIGAILVTGVSAITFYRGFWKPTGVAPAVEQATSRKAH